MLFSQILLKFFKSLLRGLVLFFLQSKLFELEPVNLTPQLIDRNGSRVNLHAQPRCGLIDQVDGLIWQLAACDVTAGECGGCHQCAIGNGDFVMGLIALFKPAQDSNGVLN